MAGHPPSPTFAELREQMVREQIEARGIRSPRVLHAMRQVARHLFVAPEHWPQAYTDRPLPTRFHQTISQPFIVALMSSLLDLRGEETVLEVGTGSGYQAAVLSCLARRVITIERYPVLAEAAAALLRETGCHAVEVRVGDGCLGASDAAPFNGILVTAAAPEPPPPLLDQLRVGGRLVLPVGQPGSQVLQVWERTPAGWTHEPVVPVSFVPLRGAYGFQQPGEEQSGLLAE